MDANSLVPHLGLVDFAPANPQPHAAQAGAPGLVQSLPEPVVEINASANEVARIMVDILCLNSTSIADAIATCALILGRIPSFEHLPPSQQELLKLCWSEDKLLKLAEYALFLIKRASGGKTDSNGVYMIHRTTIVQTDPLYSIKTLVRNAYIAIMLGDTSSLSAEARDIITRVDVRLSRVSFVSPDLAHLFTGMTIASEGIPCRKCNEEIVVEKSIQCTMKNCIISICYRCAGFERQNSAATIKAAEAFTYYCPSHLGGRISSSGGGGGGGGGGKGGGGGGGEGGEGGKGGKGGGGGEGGEEGPTFDGFLSLSPNPISSSGGGGSNAPMVLVSKRGTGGGNGELASSSSSAVNTLSSKTSAVEGLSVHSKSVGGRGGSSADLASGGGISASPLAIIGTNAKNAKRNVSELRADDDDDDDDDEEQEEVMPCKKDRAATVIARPKVFDIDQLVFAGIGENFRIIGQTDTVRSRGIEYEVQRLRLKKGTWISNGQKSETFFHDELTAL
jgi:hypothetical protein